MIVYCIPISQCVSIFFWPPTPSILLPGPFRQAINDELATNATELCPSYTPIDEPLYVVWCNSSLVNTVDQILDITIGAPGLDRLITLMGKGYDTGIV